jgi:hypothetical protein
MKQIAYGRVRRKMEGVFAWVFLRIAGMFSDYEEALQVLNSLSTHRKEN